MLPSYCGLERQTSNFTLCHLFAKRMLQQPLTHRRDHKIDDEQPIHFIPQWVVYFQAYQLEDVNVSLGSTRPRAQMRIDVHHLKP